jgi:hypothetical protein
LDWREVRRVVAEYFLVAAIFLPFAAIYGVLKPFGTERLPITLALLGFGIGAAHLVTSARRAKQTVQTVPKTAQVQTLPAVSDVMLRCEPDSRMG